MTWGRRLLVAFDQLGNTLCDGDPDETISSRVGKAALAGSRWALVAECLINAMFLIVTGERDHCRNSIEADEGIEP